MKSGIWIRHPCSRHTGFETCLKRHISFHYFVCQTKYLWEPERSTVD